jgi:hypothetical protein
MVIDMATSVNMYTTISSRHVGTNTWGSIPTYDRSATAASAAESATCTLKATFHSAQMLYQDFLTISRTAGLVTAAELHQPCDTTQALLPTDLRGVPWDIIESGIFLLKMTRRAAILDTYTMMRGRSTVPRRPRVSVTHHETMHSTNRICIGR